MTPHASSDTRSTNEQEHGASNADGNFKRSKYVSFEMTLGIIYDDDDDDDAPCHNPAHHHTICTNIEDGSEPSSASDVEASPPSTARHPRTRLPTTTTNHQHHLRLLPLAILVFYNVSGGPFGIEATVRAGGNLFAILGFSLLPLVWSIPEALVTAELGSAYPEASGGVAWVQEAFGHRAGLMAGYLGWIAGATDNAIYPVLFLEYVTSAVAGASDQFGEEMYGWHRFLIVSGTAVILAGINYTGLEIVGAASIVVAVLAMSPFVIMCIVGIPQVDPRRWLQTPEVNVTAADIFDDDAELMPGPMPLMGLGGVFWRGFLNNLFWNLNSFDSAASFAGEVRDVSKTYSRGIFLGTFLVIVCYLFPLLIATGATDSAQEEWVDGHMATIAMEIAGPWLGGWVVMAAGVSNLALFEAEMSADAWQLMGMAERGYLPRSLAARSRFGTPTYGILVGTVVIVAMSVADFSQLVEMLNFNYAISLLMEYSAFVKLRYYRGDVPRPYRIPLPNWAAVILILIPCIMIIVLFCLASWITYLYVAGVLTFGLCVYHLLEIARRRKWFEFRPKTYCKITNLGENGIGGGDIDGNDASSCATPCTESIAKASDSQLEPIIGHNEESFAENQAGIMS